MVAVGGNDTFHEVVNGMLNRSDRKKLPIALIPTGKQNDFASALSLKDVDRALDYIIKGQKIRLDIIKVLIDYDHEQDIPEKEIKNHLRYSLMHTSYSVSSKPNKKAIAATKCCRSGPTKVDRFDLQIDGVTV